MALRTFCVAERSSLLAILPYQEKECADVLGCAYAEQYLEEDFFFGIAQVNGSWTCFCFLLFVFFEGNGLLICSCVLYVARANGF